MCSRHLRCPCCGSSLAARVAIAGDNASGVYLEFLLVEAGSDDAAFAFVASTTVMDEGARLEELRVSVGADVSRERAFDDEVPWPTAP